MKAGRVASVAHVLWSGNIGGIERLVCDLAGEQVRQGLNVTVAFGRMEGPFVVEVDRGGAHVVDLELSSGYDLWLPRIRRGADALRESDVIHLHGFNLSFAALARRSRRPVVFTEHGNFGLGRTPGWKGWVKRRLQRRFLRREVSGGLVANSAHTAERLSQTYGIDANTTRIIHNGVYPESGSEVVTRAENDDLRLLFVGRLVQFKRVDRALEGLAQARRREQMRLDIVGGGPMDEQLQFFARSLGLSERVRFRGYRPDLTEILSEADVLLQPSEAEPFGLVILEGCAQGVLPIVFADGGGALEILPPDGIVVADTEELGQVLDGLVGSDALADGARAERAAWVREQFPISATASRYLELYRSALTDANR
jgi:glycosyltransferase involved in cell wall biosynthesis